MSSFTFSDDQLTLVRGLVGSTVTGVETCHPWFSQIGWEGSRRCDLLTESGGIGMRILSLTPEDERLRGDIGHLEIFDSPSDVPWPLLDHKGLFRSSGPRAIVGERIMEVRVASERFSLVRGDDELFSVTRDLGIWLTTTGGEPDFDDNGEDPYATPFFGMTTSQNALWIDVGIVQATETRFGIHCFAGDGVVDLRKGERLRHTIWSTESTDHVEANP